MKYVIWFSANGKNLLLAIRTIFGCHFIGHTNPIL
jgi:hypothetical protein